MKVYQEESKLPKSQTIRWEGYTIQSINGEVIGAVEEVIENNMQLILVVVTETGYEHMIPLVEDFIVDFDEKNQTLKLDLPDGLLDL